MRPFFPLILLAVCPLGADPVAVLVPLILYADFQVKPAERVQDTIRDELDRIMSPIGWQFEWDSLPRTNTPKVCYRLVVVRFRGSCDADDLSPYPPYPYVLGATSISDGEILPFADIYCSAIRAALAPALSSIESGERDIVFARAVGRVLSHELYHIFAHQKGHASKGVAEAHFNPQDLTAESFRFEPKQVKKLRAALPPMLHQMFTSSRKMPKGPQLFIASGCSGCHGPRGDGTRWGPTLTSSSILRETGGRFDALMLASRLTNPQSLMYRRAEDLQVLWPRLSGADLDDLAAFVRTLPRSAPTQLSNLDGR